MMCSAVSPDTEANVSVCVFQVQPGWRSEVRRDRAGAGDRLTRTSTSRGSTTQRPLHSNTNTRSLQEIETTRQNVRKLQENWEYLKPNFDAVFSSFFFFFFATWVFFKMCLFSSVDKKKKIFLFCRGGSLGFVDLPQLKVQITDTLTLWSVYFFPVRWEETNPPLVCFFDSSFRDQNPPPAALWTLCCVLCATCGSGVMLCVFLQCELNQPHTPASATSLSVCKTRGRSRSSVTRLDSICYEFQCLERRRHSWADRHFSLSATTNAEYFPDSLMWAFSVFLGLYIVINLIFLSFGWTWID